VSSDIPILIVDDYPTMRKTIGDVMRRFGFTNISYAEDGQMAWDMLQENRYGLLLLDWSMPRMSGPELLKLIRASGGAFADVPILAITAEADRKTIVDAVKGGVDGYIVKPFLPETLAAKLRDILSSRKALH
jgi:two-component system chemotaxis response regulator CheY